MNETLHLTIPVHSVESPSDNPKLRWIKAYVIGCGLLNLPLIYIFYRIHYYSSMGAYDANLYYFLMLLGYIALDFILIVIFLVKVSKDSL